MPQTQVITPSNSTVTLAPSVVVNRVARVGEVWKHVVPMLEAALARPGSTMGLAALHAELTDGRKQLWLGASAERGLEMVLVSEIVQHSGTRALVLVICTGDERARWLPQIEVIKAYGRAHGCAILRALSRPGWRRGLAAYGFRHRHDILELDLA